MKRLLMCAAAVAAVASLAACNRADNTGAEGSVSDTPGQNAAVNAAQDAMSAPVGAASAATVGRTTDGFVTNAVVGGMYEIEAGKLAQQMGKSDAVKSFGAKMVKDHTANSEKLKATLGTANAGVTPPTTLDERHQGLIDNLRAAGDNFDSVYAAQQKAGHEEMLTLMKTYAEHGDNAALKAFANETTPKVQMHLDMANKLPG